MNDINIRNAKVSDAKELVSIYAPYVENTAITFEYDVPSEEEFKTRIVSITKKYPYLVAEIDKKLVGYAYASTFKDRQAYDHCIELSIYISNKHHGQGIGRMLYEALEDKLKTAGIININACIAWIETPNKHLNHQSPAFHAKMGFKKVAHFHRCGYKFGEWYDMIWMEKLLDSKYSKYFKS